MAVTIITKNSSTASSVPSAGSLSQGELAVNVTDKKLYTKDAGGNVITLASGTAGTVTSVAATVPSVFSISGSPITTSGTLAMTYSGTALPVANGGTGLTAAGANGNVLTSNGTDWVSSAPAATGATKGQAIAFSLIFGL